MISKLLERTLPTRFAPALLLLCWGLLAASPLAAQFACLPSCSATDARFLSVIGPALGGVSPWEISGTIALPATASEVRLGVFDGNATGQWDYSGGAVPLDFLLFEDPTGTGAGWVQVGQWSGTTMVDNGWSDLVVPVSAGARAPSGAYFYRLVIRADLVPDLGWGNFKLRAPRGHELTLRPHQMLSFATRMFTEADRAVVYPSYPDLTGTTYDGEWRFRFLLTTAPTDLELWDGDLDFGALDGSTADDDDANTSAEPPAWDLGASPEGITAGSDDTTFLTFLRSPSVYYSLSTPAGLSYRNSNPSGNDEWECFVLRTALDPEADVPGARLGAGYYELRLRGADLSNAFSLYLPGPLVALCDGGRGLGACPPHFEP
jgi:hypothetical protein